ncbi:MAG TPA: universal stress protein [Solirubrobacterales bacterium]|nr:universal stress protein [Solirubrobacterales bacterium]
MRLLVGLDDREGGKDALELARVLSGREDASALVVTVLHTGPLPREYALLPEEECREAETLFEEAREKLAGVDVETRAYGGGSPAGILTTLAEREDFDAIVVGSPHRGAFGRVLVGSVATALLNGAPTDVAVAPKGYAAPAHEPLRTIAVGYDGTPEAKVGLRRAEALAKRSNAQIRVLTVVEPAAAVPVMVPGAYKPAYPPKPDKVMIEALESVDGSRGYGPLARVLLGSVSRPLVQKAPCPVLVAARA